MIRPELTRLLKTWREPIGWSVAILVGTSLLTTGISPFAPLKILAGLVLTLPALALLYPSIRRVLMRSDIPAEGVVSIDEGRIGYFGPIDGGFVDLSLLERVLVVSADGDRADHWILNASDGSRIAIPVGAEGAEDLPDALSSLPGIDFDGAVRAMQTPGRHRKVIWQKQNAESREGGGVLPPQH